MTRFETLLILQALALVGVTGGLVYYLVESRGTARRSASESGTPDASVEEPVLEGLDWIPLERIDYVVGPWATTDGDVFVSVVVGGSPEAHGFNAQPWRLEIEWRDHPFVACGMYSHLESDEASPEPWRLGYCSGVGADPAALTLTHIGWFRAKGQSQVRLRLGEYFDVELYQVQ